jgi:hypothetical protein
MTLEYATAAAGGLFVFFLLFMVFRNGLEEAVLEIAGKNPIGFALPGLVERGH